MRVLIVLGAALTIPLCFEFAQALDCVSSAMQGIEANNPQAALPALHDGAREGDERCKYVLGMWALSGTGMKRDVEAGARWLKEASQEGLPVAQSHLGLLYASGMGVEKDEAAAAGWYRAAAEYGDVLGQAALGVSTFFGVGVSKDRVEGYMWTSLAAERGNEKARAHLPGMEEAMTDAEMEQAKGRVAGFRPKTTPKNGLLRRDDVLRGFGLHREPTEYERMFGY